MYCPQYYAIELISTHANSTLHIMVAANNGDLWGTRHMNQGSTSLIIQLLVCQLYVSYMLHNMYIQHVYTTCVVVDKTHEPRKHPFFMIQHQKLLV